MHINHCQNPNCWNGTLQVQPRKVWGFFNNDQLNKLYEAQGEYNENIVVITMSDTYDDEPTDDNQCDLAHFDRLEIEADYSKRTYELVEANPTGIDRLKYYAVGTYYVQDANGNSYEEGVHFQIKDGKVHWLTQNRPGYNQAINRGTVYTIGYYIKPFYYVHHVMKEVRAGQVLDPETNEKVAVRMPQHIVCLREMLYPDTSDETGDKTSKMPRRGVLPPR
jgi:hypothetical protein